MFNGEELLDFVRQATYVAVNDYEGRLLQERTGQTLPQLSRLVKAVIVTQGAEGSQIFVGGEPIAIPSVKPDQLVDPTGCGDAYRAGLLYGIAQGYDWSKTGQLASLMGSIKIASRGGQNHQISRAEIGRRYQQAFGDTL